VERCDLGLCTGWQENRRRSLAGVIDAPGSGRIVTTAKMRQRLKVAYRDTDRREDSRVGMAQ